MAEPYCVSPPPRSLPPPPPRPLLRLDVLVYHSFQPDKLHFREASDPLWPHVLPLLREMERVFAPLATAMAGILNDATALAAADPAGLSTPARANDSARPRQRARWGRSPPPSVKPTYIVPDTHHVVNEEQLDALRELDHCLRLLLLRASHVRLLYESRDPVQSPAATDRARLQKKAREVRGNTWVLHRRLTHSPHLHISLSPVLPWTGVGGGDGGGGGTGTCVQGALAARGVVAGGPDGVPLRLPVVRALAVQLVAGPGTRGWVPHLGPTYLFLT